MTGDGVEIEFDAEGSSVEVGVDSSGNTIAAEEEEPLVLPLPPDDFPTGVIGNSSPTSPPACSGRPGEGTASDAAAKEEAGRLSLILGVDDPTAVIVSVVSSSVLLLFAGFLLLGLLGVSTTSLSALC